MKIEELLTKYEKDYDDLTSQHRLHLQAIQRVEKRLIQIQGAIEVLTELAKDTTNNTE